MAQEYKQFAIDIALTAGKIIKTNFSLGMKKEWKADNTPLTVTDTTINELVISSVKKEFPTHSVLAEEGNNILDNSEYVWVCDPVDGTIPFSHGVPTCVFSLALTRNGESILGVIYDPFMDRLFFAEKGKGAYLNNKKISVSHSSELPQSLFGICWWSGAQYDISPVVIALKKSGAKVMDVISITYMGALVASGEFAGTVFAGSKSHDSAALKIIVEEAGGKVTDIFGNEQRYDGDIKGHLITNGLLHDTLLDIIKKVVKH